jgi:hypothetical protein
MAAHQVQARSNCQDLWIEIWLRIFRMLVTADGGPDPDSEHSVGVPSARDERGSLVEDLVAEGVRADGAGLDRGGSVALAEQVVGQLSPLVQVVGDLRGCLTFVAFADRPVVLLELAFMIAAGGVWRGYGRAER